MSILWITVFCAFLGFAATFQRENVCYGKEVEVNIAGKGTLYFTPRNGFEKKLLMLDGKAVIPRLRVYPHSVRLTHLTKKDEGVYEAIQDNRRFDVLALKILDCTENITKVYMHNLEYTISEKVQYLEYTPPDNQDVVSILWNRTNTLQNDHRRGNVKRNVWRIPGVIQTDNGYYNFREGDGTLSSRVLLMVKENTRFYDPMENDFLLIRNPWSRGPWTVTFKQNAEDEPVTVMKDGSLVWNDNLFSGRIYVESEGIKINPVERKDSGTFEFRDQQGNLALSVQVEVEVNHKSHSTITFIVVAVLGLLLGIGCCCCCKKRCCKKDKSSDAANPGVIYHDMSDPVAQGPAVYYHGTNQPTGPSYPNQAYSSGYSPQPLNPPVYTEPPAVSIEPRPSHPDASVYPLQPTDINPPQPTSVYPPQPTSVYPPQPTSVYPPQPTSVYPLQPEPSLYPPLSEVVPPTSQGSAAAPTFSSNIPSSDAEPRFQLKGIHFPSASPLSSDAPSNDVYNSDKLNFL